MNEPEVFVLADHALNGVVHQIRDDQWEMQMPPSFQRRDTGRVPTLREIINYEDAPLLDRLLGLTGRQPRGVYGDNR